jgi:Zn-dependent M28 family amino/carboxypeptidase
VGVKTWKHEQYSDAFFSRSDNQALADAGIPAITLAVAWQYPDYHRAGDHWDKIDYDNFESVARAVGLTSWRVADSTETVQWIPDNTKNERYRKAWQALQGK